METTDILCLAIAQGKSFKSQYPALVQILSVVPPNSKHGKQNSPFSVAHPQSQSFLLYRSVWKVWTILCPFLCWRFTKLGVGLPSLRSWCFSSNESCANCFSRDSGVTVSVGPLELAGCAKELEDVWVSIHENTMNVEVQHWYSTVTFKGSVVISLFIWELTVHAQTHILTIIWHAKAEQGCVQVLRVVFWQVLMLQKIFVCP